MKKMLTTRKERFREAEKRVTPPMFLLLYNEQGIVVSASNLN